jgi:hypothetical protein
MDPIKFSLCPHCTECPEVVITADTVTIGEAENLVRLSHAEWNELVRLIKSGDLSAMLGREWASGVRVLVGASFAGGAIVVKEIEAEAVLESCRALIDQINVALSAEKPFVNVSSAEELLLHLESAASALKKALGDEGRP